MTPQMVDRARANLHVEVAGAEAIPYRDASFDVVISHGVSNLPTSS
jgi:ubiquinone/menaquinone biosynthesis C-methylase UbiE